MTEDNYASYLLRLWKVEHQRGSTWRVSLEDVRTREQVYLDVDGLLRLLRDRFAETGPSEGPGAEDGR